MNFMKRSRCAAVAAVALACGNIFMATTLTSCSNKAGVAADSDSIAVADSDSIIAVSVEMDSAVLNDTVTVAPVIEGVEIKTAEQALQEKVTGKELDIDLGYATYHGSLKDGLPDGQGTLTFKKSHTIIPGKDYVAEKGDVVEGIFTNGEVATATWKKVAGGSQTVSK